MILHVCLAGTLACSFFYNDFEMVLNQGYFGLYKMRTKITETGTFLLIFWENLRRTGANSSLKVWQNSLVKAPALGLFVGGFWITDLISLLVPETY